MFLKSLLVTVAIASGLVATPTSAAEVDYGCDKTQKGYTCFYGPFDVGPEGLRMNQEVVGAPDAEGFITNMRATLVASDGDQVSPHKVHLHHAVWVNTTEDDLTCPSSPGDRFFATGKERTPMNLPAGYGYHWSNDVNYWGMAAHLDGMHGDGANNVYIKLKMGFTTDPSTTPITPVWIDTKGSCTNNVTFDVPKSTDGKDRFRISAPLEMPASGDFIGMGGHLHDGGIRLKLNNRSTHERMFVSEAVYGKHDPWYLKRMTSFYGLPGKSVTEGDNLELTGVYDSTRRWRNAMAIMQLALVKDE